MQKLLNFESFLNENDVNLSSDLDEYTVESLGEGKFSVELEGSPVEFTVLPVPSNPEEYEKVLKQLTVVLEDGRPGEIYRLIENLQNMSYDFGNFISTSLSLNNVPGLLLELTDEQKALVKSDPETFLRSQFSSIDKELKAAIMSYLTKRAQQYAIVLECLFYHMRIKNTNDDHEN